MRARVRTVLLLAIAALYLFSVPWYREAGGDLSLVFGLPDWVAVALGCYVLVALLNSAAWLLTDMPEDARPPRRGSSGRPQSEPAEARERKEGGA